MRNKLFLAFLSAVVLLTTASCKKGKSYAELLKEEKTAIARYIDENNWDVRTTFPDKVPFDPHVYYLTDEGLYLQIVDEGEQPAVDFTSTNPDDDVTVRFKERTYIKNNNINSGIGFSELFKYNSPVTYINSPVVCQGFLIPLRKEYGLGHGAVVNLLIPSKLGILSEQSYVLPIFYQEVKYTASVDKQLQ